MKSFISNVVDDVLLKHKSYSKLTFVLPSQRACVFFKEELLKKITSTSFLPKIESIENYIQDLADIHLIDNTQLLFEFFSVYKKYLPSNNVETFESFSQWATTALHDFNEIDSYLVDTESFFENLRDIKKLNKWFQDKKPSNLAVNYLLFFENLNILYTELYENLKRNKFGYQGLIYREANENLEFYIKNNSDDHIVFIGFNALNKSEENIFQELLDNEMASIYWDANESFFKGTNEAGYFLRKYKKEWIYFQKNPFKWNELNIDHHQEINIVGAPKNITQIKYAGEILSQLEDFNKTALVLADENLLGLSLNSLPNEVEKLNITMGFPLKEIPLASLFEKLFRMHLNQDKLDLGKNDQFYYKDILALLNDPFLNKIFGNSFQEIIRSIKKENRIFVGLKDIKLFTSKDSTDVVLMNSLFVFSKNVNKIINQCIGILSKLKDKFEGVEKEYLYRFYLVFQQLETLNVKYQHINNLKTLTLFYQQILQNEKLSFHGEPLQGLQLMGMLETRALDFDTVIITSLNEGVLPSGKTEFSFIPFDVKKHFGLPTYLEKDAIFSYHFQRLLHRAKNIYLIYNTETDGYGSGEKSRFLTQMELKNPDIEYSTISPKVEQIEMPLIEIKKTPEVLIKLKEVFVNGISPSSLANYIYNPIKFYEQKIIGIREDDEVEETVAVNTMGTVIHEVLEQLYRPYIGKFITQKNIDSFFLKIDELLGFNFEKFYKKGSVKTGKNKLIYEVCKKHIERFLNFEKKNLEGNSQLKIIALEKKLEAIIEIEGIDFPIKFKGIVDRIDELNGVTRIIDYKTGKVDKPQLKMNDFSLISEDYKYTKAMQVMLYSYMFLSNYEERVTALESGIISFKNLRSGFIKMNFSDKFRGVDNVVTEERIHSFMIEIKHLLREIINPNIPFKQNENLPF